ncbi:alpha-amylase family glycosyl hydrolase [Prevotella sp.]|uniref:alpha-amylase family glycosyl hydrolase n=1 Tax=Prevotella sp. TaxID=59823 RepID=UPI002F9393DE
MKKIASILLTLMVSLCTMAQTQGWPSAYNGVMLQGFYWDSFADSKWTTLQSQADELSRYFSLVWIPQSGRCNNPTSMGYDPYYYFDQNSSFGSADELKSMIRTFKDKGLLTIADVVINHHQTSGWWNFPKETYKNTTYQLQTTDIVADDDSDAKHSDGTPAPEWVTATQAAKDNVRLGSHNDDGTGWAGMRDIDHQSANVQAIVKAYEQFLLHDLGYSGFRYDMVKGFAGKHVGNYNDAAKVEFSVGECWDNKRTIINWIDATGKRSAAFDFPFRYNISEAIRDGNWSKLRSTENLVHENDYRRFAVTFIENHDTEKRSETNQQDPVRSDTLAANAYMLAMPGTPCVFFKHWQDYKQDIKAMIDARKAAGITNTSSYSFLVSSMMDHAVVKSMGRKDLIAVIGNTDRYTPSAQQFTKIISGYHYAYYLSNNAEIAFANRASGEYVNKVDVTLSAVSAKSNAKIVYTTDGSTPTATHGTQVDGGTVVSLTENCTLTFGLLINGVVSAIDSRTYQFSRFDPYDIKVYVNAEAAGSKWTAANEGVNYWTWGGDGSHQPQHTSWPGDKVSTQEKVDGKLWISKTFRINSPTDCVNFVFSVGSGTPQTVNLENVRKTTFVNIGSSTDNQGHHQLTTTVPTAINHVTTTEPTAQKGWFTLQGVRIGKPTTNGIYIHDGRKIVIRR